jgi:hypothetical protein
MRGRAIPGWAPAAVALVSVASLFAPWLRSGQRQRSSIELLDSASALRVLEGSREWLAVSAWVAIPVLTGFALVALAWGRERMSARLLLPVGPLLGLAFLTVTTSPFSVLWGAFLGVSAGLATTSLASLILIAELPRRKG